MKDPTRTLSTPVRIDENLCTGCGRCATACSRGVLEMLDLPGGRRKPIAVPVNPAACVQCGMCVSACRRGAVSIPGGDAPGIAPLGGGVGVPERRGFFTRRRHRRRRRRFGRGGPGRIGERDRGDTT
ncbi:MAG: ferredoxin family protein [Spirochaetes bacterium]|nr:ferredoxin family protein [Spirochaetota bacterium]